MLNTLNTLFIGLEPLMILFNYMVSIAAIFIKDDTNTCKP